MGKSKGSKFFWLSHLHGGETAELLRKQNNSHLLHRIVFLIYMSRLKQQNTWTWRVFYNHCMFMQELEIADVAVQVNYSSRNSPDNRRYIIYKALWKQKRNKLWITVNIKFLGSLKLNFDFKFQYTCMSNWNDRLVQQYKHVNITSQSWIYQLHFTHWLSCQLRKEVW